jgi:thioredoxin 1
MSKIQHIEEKNFAQAISKGLVLVDFFAEWCAPCRVLTPILEALATELEGKVSIIKVDVDEAQAIASQYDITSVPTIIIFEEGNMKQRIVGLKDLKSLKALLE